MSLDREAVARAARRLRGMPPRCQWTDDDDTRCALDAVVRLPEFGGVVVCKLHDQEFSAGVQRDDIDS